MKFAFPEDVLGKPLLRAREEHLVGGGCTSLTLEFPNHTISIRSVVDAELADEGLGLLLIEEDDE